MSGAALSARPSSLPFLSGSSLLFDDLLQRSWWPQWQEGHRFPFAQPKAVKHGVDLHKVSVFLNFPTILQRAPPRWENWASLACSDHRHPASREVALLLPEERMDRSTEIRLVWSTEGSSPRSWWLATPAWEWKAVKLEEPVKGSLLPPAITRPSYLQRRFEQP